jgi:hypothetical protein
MGTYHWHIPCAVEKWHFKKNHVGKYCKENCNPDHHPEVEKFNTVICEQRFKFFPLV